MSDHISHSSMSLWSLSSSWGHLGPLLLKAVRVAFWAQSVTGFKERNSLAGIQETTDW